MHILVGLMEHMGDIIACEPVSRYLKANHPAASLTWAVSPAYRELVDTNPYIDQTLVLECLTDWIKLTKHSSYEKIVDLHVNYRVCQHCGIPLIKETGNPFVNVYEWFDYGTIQEAFTLGAGLPALSAQPNLYLKPEHAKAVDALALPESFCVVHLESNNSAKDWKRGAWHALSAWISDNLKLQIVEVGAGKAASPSPLADGSISLVNKLPILQTAEVIRRARFFIGVDSGPAHLANALQVPSIVLLGRLGFFRHYMPFNGFFASASPLAKMVRNPAGPVSSLTVAEVIEAVRYVAAASVIRRNVPVSAILDTPEERSRTSTASMRSSSYEEDRTQVLTSGFFDAGWYSIQYPDVNGSGMDPLEHFLTIGKAEARSPGPNFDASRYLQVNEDVARAECDALLHYIRYGRNEGRQRYAHAEVPAGWPEEIQTASRAKHASMHSVFDQTTTTKAMILPRNNANDRRYPQAFAFYLPQFHPIAENNWAHGHGFTEWHNVVKTMPLFRGHYQPRIPGELGFYDLRSVDVLREQLSLARQYGVSGFCFYYYYFQGKKLLYQPLQHYIASDLDAPFFLLWANENWSKRWDGGDREVIIEQQHSKVDDLAFIRELLPLFKDDRYVKIAGKPLLLIYKPHLFPDVLSTTEIWREDVEQYGFPGLYLVMADDWFSDQFHPRQYGFDASYEIPSNLVPEQVLSTELEALDLHEGFEGRIVDYPKFARFHLGRSFPEYKRFRTVMLPWDNTARYGLRAIVHINGQGDAYKVWLMQALLDTYRRYTPDERMVFLHSWNEWCEGTYLEPDSKFGRMFLEQTGEAIRIVRQAVDLMAATPESAAVMAELLKVVQAKDESAFRMVQVTRAQTAYVWRELENIRNAERLARAERDAVYASKSWRLTRPLRVITDRLRTWR